MLGYEYIVTKKNQKVYILFELDPSWEMIGGAWYTKHILISLFH